MYNLPISNWTLLTLHFLLNIYKNTWKPLSQNFRGIKTMIFLVILFKKYTGDQQQIEEQREHHVCEYPVKFIASNAL